MVRINGKIRAREVRVVGEDGHQLGVLSLSDAIRLAQSQGVDLVEVAAAANPPVCRLVDYGKYRYEQSKRDKEAKKHQHANRMKEIQLSASIDEHDFSVKLGHAIDFLCEEMKVKLSLRFRGREMAHTEYGFQVIEKFLNELAAYGHPDSTPKLVGRGINLMVSPLPRNKRARNPRLSGEESSRAPAPVSTSETRSAPLVVRQPNPVPAGESNQPVMDSKGGFNNPFAGLEIKVDQ